MVLTSVGWNWSKRGLFFLSMLKACDYQSAFLTPSIWCGWLVFLQILKRFLINTVLMFRNNWLTVICSLAKKGRNTPSCLVRLLPLIIEQLMQSSAFLFSFIPIFALHCIFLIDSDTKQIPLLSCSWYTKFSIIIPRRKNWKPLISLPSIVFHEAKAYATSIPQP